MSGFRPQYLLISLASHLSYSMTPEGGSECWVSCEGGLSINLQSGNVTTEREEKKSLLDAMLNSLWPMDHGQSRILDSSLLKELHQEVLDLLEMSDHLCQIQVGEPHTTWKILCSFWQFEPSPFLYYSFSCLSRERYTIMQCYDTYITIPFPLLGRVTLPCACH